MKYFSSGLYHINTQQLQFRLHNKGFTNGVQPKGEGALVQLPIIAQLFTHQQDGICPAASHVIFSFTLLHNQQAALTLCFLVSGTNCVDYRIGHFQ